MTHIIQNNEVYGLTKGQTSPTSEKGFKSNSAPQGALEEPVNPIALANSGLTYYASDIKEDELSLIKRFFKKNKIKGKLFVQDLTKSSLNFPKTDICLILKVLDTIDPNHVLTETLLKKVHSKYFIISFSTCRFKNVQPIFLDLIL